MAPRGHWRGHPIVFDEAADEWCYEDTGEPTASSPERPCCHCGEAAGPDGHDPCLGTLPGVLNACCGHGSAADAYVVLEDTGERLAGEKAHAAMAELAGHELP